jgi:hypothetical protein
MEEPTINANVYVFYVVRQYFSAKWQKFDAEWQKYEVERFLQINKNEARKYPRKQCS